MKGKLSLIFMPALAFMVCGVPLEAQENLQSLRGMNPMAEISDYPEWKSWAPDRGLIPRNFVQQPPLVPHAIEGYEINLKFNACLSCHSWATYLETGATKISQTHFNGRDGFGSSNVSPGRYFCNQCHVSQREVAPLVENTFEPIKGLQQ